MLYTNLYGTYNFHNISAAIAIGDHFGVEPERIIDGIERYTPDNNRSQLIKTQKNTVLMDAYNANPTSMDMAVNSFNNYPGENKVLILGDMMELGNESRLEHQRIKDLAMSFDFDKVILVGSYFAELGGQEQVFLNVEEARGWLLRNPVTDSAILVKGSRKIELEKLLDVL